MSLAENLLNSLTDTTYSNERIGGSVDEEEHIVVDSSRNIIVPDYLKVIAVEGDKDIETVTVDCIRYWDEHDLSTFSIYVKCDLPNGDEVTYIPKEIVVKDNYFSFNWVIGREITPYFGKLTFWVVAKVIDEEGKDVYQWSSLQNDECYIARGGGEIYTTYAEEQKDESIQNIQQVREIIDGENSSYLDSQENVEESHILVDEKRNITVPNELKIIAVKGDKDVETVTIDCVRHWNIHDLSTFVVYINYTLPNGKNGTYIPDKLTVKGDIFSFNWLIGRHITSYVGSLTFWIVAKTTDDEGDLEHQWSSFQNTECSIAQGGDKIYVPEEQTDKDVITQAISISLNAAERAEAAAERAEAIGGAGGNTGGVVGERGTGILKITTAPSSYTTTTGGFTPVFRIALSTVLTQSKTKKVLVGDTIAYSYYQYPVGYVDSSYVYLGNRNSIRGATGVGIESIEKTSSVGTVDTYTITYTNGAEYSFNVTNGKSAYEYAKEGGYTGTEEEFYEDINPDSIKANAEDFITTELAKRGQLKPEFAQSVEELNALPEEARSKLYVLLDKNSPDYGYIFAYQYVEAGQSYTNLAGNVQYDRRLSSSGKISSTAMAGAAVTDFIPVKKGDIVRIKGINIKDNLSSSAYPYVCFYTGESDDNVTDTGTAYLVPNQHPEVFNGLDDSTSGGVVSWTAFAVGTADGTVDGKVTQHANADNITYIRISGKYFNDNEITVTVNEEITEGGSEGGYAWVNTGLAFVPANYEGRIFDLENNKADKGDIPTKLPNPNKLTINGVEYDGSKAVDISITASSGGSNQENNTNLFSFENANVNFSWIASGPDDKIYDTSSDYGYKDTANLRFVSKKSTNTRVAVTGGLPKLPAGEYIVTAEVYMPSEGSHTLAVGFGGCTTRNHKQYNDYIPLSAYDKWITVTERFTVTEEDTAVYIAMMCTGTDHETYWRNVRVVSADDYESTESGDYSGNILKGKKWVACGDSFTAGGYNASDGFDESVYIYQDGRFAGQNIVYPFIIGLRNNMTIKNLATGGQTMAITSANNSFMTRYANIDADADYITIMLGINDKLQSVSIGALDSVDNTTFCGAFNVAMEHIIENHPFAHIGIMVSHGTNAEIMQATRGIAERWGIPYLDYGSPQVPLMNRYTGRNVCEKAQQIREKNFCVISDGTTPTNSHPNTAAHEYESTFIEAWLRTL